MKQQKNWKSTRCGKSLNIDFVLFHKVSLFVNFLMSRLSPKMYERPTKGWTQQILETATMFKNRQTLTMNENVPS